MGWTFTRACDGRFLRPFLFLFLCLLRPHVAPTIRTGVEGEEKEEKRKEGSKGRSKNLLKDEAIGMGDYYHILLSIKVGNDDHEFGWPIGWRRWLAIAGWRPSLLRNGDAVDWSVRGRKIKARKGQKGAS